MSTIVRTFMGNHMDLSKIVSISDAYFIDRMGSGGYFVGCDIHCQLLDKPIKYERELQHDDEYKGTLIRNTKGDLVEGIYFIYGKDYKDILAVDRLQKQIDDLVEQWKTLTEGVSND